MGSVSGLWDANFGSAHAAAAAAQLQDSAQEILLDQILAPEKKCQKPPTQMCHVGVQTDMVIADVDEREREMPLVVCWFVCPAKTNYGKIMWRFDAAVE